MKRCPSPEQLEQFLEEKLDHTEAGSVSEHIQSCGQCQTALEQMTHDDDTSQRFLTTTAPAEPSLPFLERLKRSGKPAGFSSLGLANARTGDGPDGESVTATPEIDGYTILGVLGRGGMGVVYRAEQVGLNRIVALKMILAGPHASPRDQARFRQEAEAVARLHHANIVQVFDVGESEGRPYFALEYVGGGSLAKHLHGDPQAIPPTLWLIEQLAVAVDFAHRHGVIHRDLKPSNVLLEMEAGSVLVAPGDHGSGILTRDRFRPKITDFGLAKRLGENEGGTITGEVLGTPSYMAPEQASGKGLKIGPAADVYALGAILYEMLTGRPPFKGATPFDTVLQVLHQEPVRPSSLRPGLPRDLETICLKCLEKEPRKRYTSAAELAEDIRRFRQGKPIQARPVGSAERAWKWARRRPVPASLAAGIVLVTALGFAGITWQWREAARARDTALVEKKQKEEQTQRAEEARRDAELARRKEADQRERARVSLYFNRIARSQLQWRVNDLNGAKETLNAGRSSPGSADRRSWEWHYLNRLFHSELFVFNHAHAGEGGGVVFRPDGERIASVVSGGGRQSEAAAELRIWNARDGAVIRCQPLADPLHRLAYRPDGSQLALVSSDGWLVAVDANTGRERFRQHVHSDAITSVAYSQDGRRLVTASWDRTAVICNADTGEIVQTLRGSLGKLQGAVLHPDNKRVATVGWDEKVKIWEIQTGQVLQEFVGHKGPVYCVAFSPDGKLLASAGSNGNLKVWDLAAGLAVQNMTGHAGAVLDIAFSPDGRYLAYGGGDGTVRVWDVESGVEGVIFRGHAASVESVRFSPDGQRIASASPGDGTVQVWDFTRHPRYATFAHTRADIEALVFPTSGQEIISYTADGRLQHWDAETGILKNELVFAPKGTKETALGPGTLDPAGRRLAIRAPGDARTVLLYDTDTGRELCKLVGHSAPVAWIRFSHDGSELATGANVARADKVESEIKIWTTSDAREIGAIRDAGATLNAAFSADGKLLALAKRGGGVFVFDVMTREAIHNLAAHTGDTAVVAFSLDGKLLASAGADDRSLKIWNLASLAVGSRRALRGPAPPQIGDLAFTPDGRRLAAVSRDLVQIWDSATGQEVLTLRGAPQRHWDPPFHPRLAFNADGTRLAASNWDETISVWDADMPDVAAEYPAYQAKRRASADQRATYWHLQEAQHCIEHKNPTAARYHLAQIEGKTLSPTLQTLKDRVMTALK
jgi:WD40 repeat protein